MEHRYRYGDAGGGDDCSDFVRLDKELSHEYPNHNLPIKLPPKKMLNSLKPMTVDERKVRGNEGGGGDYA